MPSSRRTLPTHISLMRGSPTSMQVQWPAQVPSSARRITTRTPVTCSRSKDTPPTEPAYVGPFAGGA